MIDFFIICIQPEIFLHATCWGQLAKELRVTMMYCCCRVSVDVYRRWDLGLR